MARILERDGECALFPGWLDDLVAGRGHVVFMGGEAGIGKSTLVAEIGHAASRRAVRSVVGHCDALVTARALGPFRDVMTRLRIEVAPALDAVLAALTNDLRDAGPLLLVVEDAHWADDASAELVALLEHHVSSILTKLDVVTRTEAATLGLSLGIIEP